MRVWTSWKLGCGVGRQGEGVDGGVGNAVKAGGRGELGKGRKIKGRGRNGGEQKEGTS